MPGFARLGLRSSGEWQPPMQTATAPLQVRLGLPKGLIRHLTLYQTHERVYRCVLGREWTSAVGSRLL
jgi:hypothetical protein